MKKKRTRSKRIAAALLGVLLVCALLTGMSTLTGNPLVAALGEGRAARYAAKTYGVEVDEVSSGVKDGGAGLTYAYRITVKDSPDSMFVVWVPFLGKITEDSYDFDVTLMHNTYSRMGEELADMALAALADTPIYNMVKECKATYGYAPDENNFPEIPFKEAFTLDMPFDPDNISLPTQLALDLTVPVAEEAAAGEILSQLKAAMELKGVRVDYYRLFLEQPDANYDASVMSGLYLVENIAADDIP